jgi:hypothetical protein
MLDQGLKQCADLREHAREIALDARELLDVVARAGEPVDAGDAEHADPGVGMEDGFGALCEQQHRRLAQDDRGARAIRQPAPDEVVRRGRIASAACGHRVRQELRVELCKLHGCPTSLRGQRASPSSLIALIFSSENCEVVSLIRRSALGDLPEEPRRTHVGLRLRPDPRPLAELVLDLGRHGKHRRQLADLGRRRAPEMTSWHRAIGDWLTLGSCRRFRQA